MTTTKSNSFNLAIETSGRNGSVAIGRGESILQPVLLSHDPANPRKGAELMPAIDQLCQQQNATPQQIAQIYVSIGPGSFTGLRIAVTTAKMLGQTIGAKLVAVPTIEVIAHNAPPNSRYVAVCLNMKRDTMYAGVYERDGDEFNPVVEPALTTLDELLDKAPRPLAVIGDPLPNLTLDAVQSFTGDSAIASAKTVYSLGYAAALRDEFADGFDLVPLYVRVPEAVELWNKRHGATSS